ncbi:flagellar protein FliS [Alkalicoccus urumqiensis]|uniref:flagellar export chaperone FliS n=1 Tax=Alkalicoccus urumqiensis TaxID=1548213 RepID=UPI0015E5E4ED|nr:flagellar protein FliS [Alkalicoccus urumqiensis]
MLTNEALYQKTPQQLTTLLYEALLERLTEAEEAAEAKNYAAASKNIQKAVDILTRLGSGLNYEAGIVADQLEQVYNYAADELVRAVYSGNYEVIGAVRELLQPVAQAWNKAASTSAARTTAGQRTQTQAYDKLSMYE